MIRRFIQWLKRIFTKMERDLAFQPNITPEYWSTQEKLFLNLVNNYREHLGVGILTPEQFIKNVSELRAITVKRHFIDDGNVLSHKDFPYVQTMIVNEGLKAAGENLAYGFSGHKACFDSFLSSEVHKRNMIDPDWLYCGITINQIEDRNLYVMLFAK